MPISMPGWPVFSFPAHLEKEEKDIWFDASDHEQCEIEDEWFDAQEYPLPLVSLSQDCLNCIKQIISQYADIKQKQYIFNLLGKYLSGLPVDFLNTAHSLYTALIQHKDIDIALLNTLGMASAYFLANGNVIAVMAECIRNAIAYYIGDDFIRQFLGSDDGPLFTALAVLAIVTKYCGKDSAQPQRALLRIPTFLAGLIMRANYYWNQLGYMAQYATETCRMPVQGTSNSYLCSKNNLYVSDTTERQVWTCDAFAQSSKTTATCDFAFSAQALALTQQHGVVRWQPEENEIPPVTSSSQLTSAVAAAVMLPITASQLSAGNTALGTALAVSMGYAWYSMFGKTQPATAKQTLSEEELAMLSARTAQPQLEQQQDAPTLLPPFSSAEQARLESDIEQLWRYLEAPAVRAKRETHNNSTTQAPLSRRDYWQQKQNATRPDAPEYLPLSQMASGIWQNDTFAVPKESFPSLDSAITLMDRLNPQAFKNPRFFINIQNMTREIAQGNIANIPDGTLPHNKWLHLRLFWQALFLRVLMEWGKNILRMDSMIASEYKIAVEQIDAVIKYLGSGVRGDVNLPIFTKKQAPLLLGTIKNMQGLHDKLMDFNLQQQKLLSTRIRKKGWLFNNTVAGKHWTIGHRDEDIYSTLYLNEINLSRFTSSFRIELRDLLNAVLNLQHEKSLNKASIDPVLFYKELSSVAMMRLLNALMDDDPVKAYNYAVLDEVVIKIIIDCIARDWQKDDFENFMHLYFSSRDNVWLEYRKMVKRIKKETLPLSTNNVTSLPETSPPVAIPASEYDTRIFGNINQNSVMDYIAKHSDERIVTERKKMDDVLNEFITEKAKDFISTIQNLNNLDIFEPGTFLNKWIIQQLKDADLDGQLTPDSPVTVTGYVHIFARGMTSQSIRNTYSLRDIVRGRHRREDVNSYSIRWPQGVDENLQNRFLAGFEHDVQHTITKAYDNPRLVEFFRILTRRAALGYLAKKSALLGSDSSQREFSQNRYINAVSGFLTGSVKPKLLSWLGEQFPDLIFIPISDENEKTGTEGVILSISNDDYYDIAYPGLACSSMLTIRQRPADMIIENDHAFQTFIKNSSVPRITAATNKFSQPFAYQKETVFGNSVSGNVCYTAPFKLIDTDDYLNSLRQLQKRDLIALYDDFIDTRAEYIRSQLSELFNVLAITSSLAIMGVGMAVGGPVWSFVAASLASTMLLEGIPNAILSTQADDDNERQLYLYTMIAAIAMEVLPVAPAPATGRILNKMSFKLIHQGVTGASTTLNPLARMIENVLSRASAQLKTERLRVISEHIHFISVSFRERFDGIIKKINTAKSKPADARIKPSKVPANNVVGARYAAGVNSEKDVEKSAAKVGGGEIESSAQQVKKSIETEIRIWTELHRLFDDEQLVSWYRAVFRWDKDANDKVDIEYMAIIKKEDGRVDDILAVTKIEHNQGHAHIYSAESEWAQNIRDTAMASDMLVKYIDFDDFYLFLHQYPEFAASSAKLSKDHYLDSAKTLYAPQAYRDSVFSRTGINYNDIQQMLSKSRDIKRVNRIPSNKVMQQGAVKLRELEPIRKITFGNTEVDMMAKEINADQLVRDFMQNTRIKKIMSMKKEDGRGLMLVLNTFIIGHSFSDTKIRRLFIWRNAGSKIKNHFVLLGSKHGHEYVFDLLAAKLNKKISGLDSIVVMRESDWAQKCQQGISNYLIKYRDFANEQVATTIHSKSLLQPDDFIKEAVILHLPDWYVSMRKINVEQLVTIPESPIPFSSKLKQYFDINEQELDWQAVMNIELAAEPTLREKELAARVAEIKDVGQDIKKFYPISPPIVFRYDTEQIIAHTKAIEANPNAYRIGVHLPGLKEFSENNGHQNTLKAIGVIYDGFHKADKIVGELVALIDAVKKDTALMERFIGRLAIFLNEKNQLIISEAFKYFEETMIQTRRVLDYHIVETKFSKVVPMALRKNTKIKSLLAFTYPDDPAARIMVVLDNYYRSDISETIIHETTHLSIDNVDLLYLTSKADDTGTLKLPGVDEAHKLYGSEHFLTPGLQFSLGTMQLGRYSSGIIERAMTPDEVLIATARIQRLPMLRANSKMQNPDSIVVLAKDLQDNFIFTRTPQGKWEITLRDVASVARSKRDASERDKIQVVLEEEIFAVLLIQALFSNSEQTIPSDSTTHGSTDNI